MDMKTFGSFFLLLLLELLVNGNPVADGQAGKHVLCYFEGVSSIRPQQEVRFFPEDLDLDICTHVVYNRAQVGEDLHVVPRDKEVDLAENGGLGLFDRTVALKERKPGLKVVLDLYDHNKELKKYTNNSETLATFAKNAAEFAKAGGFDGINFRVRNHEGFLETVPFLHEELSSKGLLLMTFLLPLEPVFTRKYEMTEELSRNFDLVVVGSYWKFPRTGTIIFSSTKDLEREMSRYTASGVPSEKLVAAIPAFCMSLLLCDREEAGVNSTVCGVGDEGSHEPPTMILHQSEIMQKIANATEEWVVARDEESGVKYGYSKTLQWTSFEDPVSVRAKAAVVLEQNLAGISIMNNDMEDFKGAYTENGVTFPLTRAAYKALHGES